LRREADFDPPPSPTQVLTTSLEDPTFNLKHIDIANTIVQSVYLGTVIASFLVSMGNRPKANRWKYMVIMCACDLLLHLG
jgi:chitin synthase